MEPQELQVAKMEELEMMRQQQQFMKEKKRKSTTKKNKNKKKSSSSSSKKERKEYALVSYDELPDYMKENEFIRNHYRSEWPLSNAFFSLFSWHNETINIWTHLLGFFVFLGFTLVHLGYLPQVAYFFGPFPWSITSSAVENASCNQANFFSVSSSSTGLLNLAPTTPAAPRWPFLVFLAGSMICLITSTSCHLLCCHSHQVNVLFTRLDYTGIALMIITSFFPPIYYLFQCTPLYQLTYLSLISLLGLLTVLSLLSPHVSRSHRAFQFVAMAMFGVMPAVHATVVFWNEPRRNVTLGWEGAMAGAYLVGTGFYVSRVPERWWPGKFDLAGSSHQIFHLFVVAGALAHYGAGLVFLEYRDAVGCV